MPERKAFDTTVRGTPITLYSDEYNSFIGAGLAERKRQQGNRVPENEFSSLQGIVNVKNMSPEDIQQYHMMVVVGLLFTPTDDEDGFKESVALKVDIYNENDPEHLGANIVILQDPLPKNGIGLAMLSGTTQIRANMTNMDHTCLRKENGLTVMESSTGGEAAIIAKEKKAVGEVWVYATILGGQLTRAFEVIGLEEDDIVTCYELIDGEAGPLEVKIALPYLLRRTPFDKAALDRDGFTYEYDDFDKRVSTDVEEEDEEDQQITPSYIEGDIIYATKCIAGGTDVKDENDIPIEWLEDNRDAREFKSTTFEDEEEAEA